MDKQVDFQTPSGYKIKLRSELSYGQFLDLQAIVSGKAKFDPISNTLTELDTSAATEYQMKELEFMIISIVMPDGGVVENNMGAVRDMPRKDGMALQAKIRELNADLTPAKKN